MQIPAELESALANGLVTAIAQDHQTNQVLMLAWMNQAALEQTLTTKRATYFSRSRNQLWVKGETSGNFQEVLSIEYDCDADALLLKVNQIGPACHAGTKSCFSNTLPFPDMNG
ncbi:MAG: phosphoribosyl-AMP cyclohydrolase [Candidatus Nanopelagicaceae bacterium]|jgi:phosphoribosyl-AMP cyclohydrolase